MKKTSNQAFYKPEGMYAAIITPFQEDGRVNETELRGLIDWLIEKGLHGIVPLGSIGEFIHLDNEEKKRVLEVAIDAAGGRVPVLAGATETCSQRCIDQAKHASQVGCSGILVAPPYYLKINQEMLEAHYEEVAQALPDFPLVLYNIPPFSTPLGYDVVKRLSRLENVVGMKDSSGSMVDQMNFMDKIKIAGEEINYLIGKEEMVFSALMAGGKGAITGSCGVIPEAMVGIYQAYQEQNYDKSLQIQRNILFLIRAMLAVPFPLGFKAALECRGLNPGPSMQRLSSAEEYSYFKVKSRIFKILKQLTEGGLLDEK